MGEAVGQGQKRRYFAYESVLAVILGLTFGTVLFDRGAIGFLSPFIVADLRLTNAQLGLAASIISLTWAIGGFFVGRASDTAGRRKPFLIGAVVIFSLCSAITGLVGGFASLVAVRLAMGMAEGPVPPLAAALLLGASSDHRRGVNIGIYAFFAGLVGSVFAPVVLVGLANQFGWRATFLLAGLPSLALVLTIAFGVREIAQASTASVVVPQRSGTVFELLQVRNISLCAVIAGLLMACMVVILIFLPLYLVQVRRLSPVDMSLVMTALGAATLAANLMLSALSDRLGRKTIMAGFAGLGAILPLGCLFWTGGVGGLAVIAAFGALPGALLPLAIGMIPAESVRLRDRGAALGLVMGVAELAGGFITPSLAGVLADRAGLAAALALAGGCTIAAALLSLWLRETAPEVRHCRQSASGGAGSSVMAQADDIAWPCKRGEIRDPVMDSTCWNDFAFRDDDIVIATYAKSGTTLTQQIVAQLVFHADPDVFGQAVSPWVDFRLTPEAPSQARDQTHRRFLKTHLPLPHLVFSPKAKYLFVARDPRDVAWSLHNHLINFTPSTIEAIAKATGFDPPPPPDPDIRRFYHAFLDGAAQATPFWSYIQEWWDVRSLPNILLLHYAELIADLPGQIRHIAAFLDIPLDEALLPAMVSHCSLAHMRKVAANDPVLNRHFRHGAETFINKGTNGRWRERLSQDEIDKCDRIAARKLTPNCAAWLRQGRS